MKREEKKPTGMYIKTTKSASVQGKSNKPTKQGTKDVADLMFEYAKAAGESYRTFLDAIERHAQAIAESEHSLDTQREDAEQILRDLKFLRHTIAGDDTYKVAYLAITIGRTYERMTVRPFEAYAKRGRNQLASVATARQKRSSKASKGHHEIRAAVTGLILMGKANGEEISKNRAMALAHEKLRDQGQKVSPETIKRACKTIPAQQKKTSTG